MREISSLMQVLRSLAQILVIEDQPHLVTQMLSAIELAREELGVQLTAVDQAKVQKVIERSRERAGEAEFRQAWADGRGMSLEQAVAVALAELDSLGAPSFARSPRQSGNEKIGGLTAREREVAAHVAQGESNREIAEALVVTERTVESHVTHILHKLGFTSRAEIRKWMLEKGMVKRTE
jgi:non-specific serine/threonine protein kinase